MNQTNSKTQTSKLPEIIAIILVVAAVGYYFYSSSNSSASSSSFTVSTATSSVGSNVLNLLNQIHSLNISTALFQSPAYQSLNDFTVAVPPETIGKANPFLPAGASTNAVLVSPGDPSTSASSGASASSGSSPTAPASGPAGASGRASH